MEIIRNLVGIDSDQGAVDLIDSAIEGFKPHAPKTVWKRTLQFRIKMLPEPPAATDHVFPKARLALVDAGRRTPSERRAFEGRIDPLFVNCVSRLMQRCKERTYNIALIDAGCDPNVAPGKLRAERMMRPIKATALEVVAYLGDDAQPEIELHFFIE